MKQVLIIILIIVIQFYCQKEVLPYQPKSIDEITIDPDGRRLYLRPLIRFRSAYYP